MWYCRSQAAKFGTRGARIVSISPGSIDTAMGRLEEQSGSGAMLRHAALKRFGRPEEVAELLAFCASDRAGYVTGIDILCDGGVVASMTIRDKLAVAREHLKLRPAAVTMEPMTGIEPAYSRGDQPCERSSIHLTLLRSRTHSGRYGPSRAMKAASWPVDGGPGSRSTRVDATATMYTISSDSIRGGWDGTRKCRGAGGFAAAIRNP